MFSLSGFENLRRISDEETNTAPLRETDWVDEVLKDEWLDVLPPITRIEKLFFIENCKLAQLGCPRPLLRLDYAY